MSTTTETHIVLSLAVLDAGIWGFVLYQLAILAAMLG